MTGRRLSLLLSAGALGLLLLAGGGWWLFVLVCPTREWPILRWSLERRTAAAWNRPQTPALVAENALEMGGRLGAVLGRRLYQRALVSGEGVPWLTRPTPYGQAHLKQTWIETTSLSWSAKRFTKHAVLVKVSLTAILLYSVPYGTSCRRMGPVTSVVNRDYVTVPTKRGWRVAAVYPAHPGHPTPMAVASRDQSAAALLAGC